MGIVTGNVKYSANELEAIIKQGTIELGFKPESEIRAKNEPNNGIRLRNHILPDTHIFTLFQKKYNESTRKIALFSAAKDTDDHEFLNEISSLDGVLKIFNEQKYSDQYLELMIPITKCNQWSKHWNFLHIIKRGNTYTAKLYEPKGVVSFQSFYSHSYIRNTITKYFPNCKFQIEYLAQQDDDTICGICTAENIIDKFYDPHCLLSGNIKEHEDELRLKHLVLYKKEYPEWQEQEETQFIIKNEIKNQKNVTIDGDEWDISMESGAVRFPDSVANLLPMGEQSRSTDITHDTSNQFKELIEEKKSKIASDQGKTILTAKEYLIEIKKTIFKINDWQTGLGGESVNFFNKNREYINSTSVPFGVKEILNEIKKVQNNEENFEEAFVKIQEIARKKLQKPRFSCCLFQVRSDLTTNFYSWIAQLDRIGRIKPLSLTSVESYSIL